ncbi:soluble quino protein glucose dehydrogenase [Mollisia scopiformis]|uniref:Soluble quino protein glucose dehydrogenase n=1 Tax=Mollisia scopiformis TaxID=149040 RepID=A0A194XKG3_MOLSC|nr:soluble quino protein glucose dehydrogenase [Mollisia scopiformis]KUJ20631.1 soluble quino protein glucose dehydrogenase [Mollisia scopiformis]
MKLFINIVLGAILSEIVSAITCNLKPTYPTPSTSDGWQAQLVANELTSPRSILFDGSGNLLVVQSGAGIVHLAFDDGGSTCLDVSKKTFLVNSTELNHGIALSNDGKTLYASSSEAVYSWSYDASAISVSTTNQTLVTGMTNDDHTTRTLLMSQKSPGTLLISRGSTSNIDPEAALLSSGHSQIKAFNTSNLTKTSTPYDFNTQGLLLGWGLRNSVGVAEEPLTGGIYSVENSADEIDRDGVDIHENNPGEEMNFHGFLNGSTQDQGGNYGYPACFALWNTSIPDLGSLVVGDQFTLQQNATFNDSTCNEERVAPRLTFQAHMAPLDIVFLENGTEAYISFHGSWDRTNPIGYKVSSVSFSTGEPTAAKDSTNSTVDIFANKDNSQCPDGCFRPVGLAVDGKGRLWVSSDATGELYVLARTSTATATSSGASPSATKKGMGMKVEMGDRGLWVVVLLMSLGFGLGMM